MSSSSSRKALLSAKDHKPFSSNDASPLPESSFFTQGCPYLSLIHFLSKKGKDAEKTRIALVPFSNRLLKENNSTKTERGKTREKEHSCKTSHIWSQKKSKPFAHPDTSGYGVDDYLSKRQKIREIPALLSARGTKVEHTPRSLAGTSHPVTAESAYLPKISQGNVTVPITILFHGKKLRNN